MNMGGGSYGPRNIIGKLAAAMPSYFREQGKALQPATSYSKREMKMRAKKKAIAKASKKRNRC